VEENPEVFGLHSNGKISLRISESSYMLASLLAMQPRAAASGSGDSSVSTDDQVLSAIEGVLKMVPTPLRRSDAGYSTFVTVASSGAMHSLGTVLLQEMDKYNVLVDAVVSTAHELRSAVKGLVVMSMELDVMYTAVLNNKVRAWRGVVLLGRGFPTKVVCVAQVPEAWSGVGYPSLKPLGSWLKDLVYRVEFMRDWLTHGPPSHFPLSAFVFPQARCLFRSGFSLFSRFVLCRASLPASCKHTPACTTSPSMRWNLASSISPRATLSQHLVNVNTTMMVSSSRTCGWKVRHGTQNSVSFEKRNLEACIA
jgi:hypothetical protein